MATTFVDYTGDGNATKAFTFPSIQESDIKVEVDNVLKSSGTHYNITGYSTTGGGNVVFTSGNIPASPADIRIFRETDVDTPKATYTAGASVKAADLNSNQEQILFGIQEEQNQTIQTHEIKDSAVTTAKIKDANVTTAKIADSNVTTAKIADSAVTSAKIADGAIVNADVNASAAIAGTKIAPDFGSQNIATTGTVDGRDVSTDGAKLDGIEAGATADQTNAEIRAAVEAATDSNVFTDADHTKLNGIETAATADQTASEIKTLLQSDKLTLSEINTTSTDSRYFTETESDARYFRQDSTETIASGDTWSSADTHIATTGAINARIVDLIDDVGGFTAITSEQHFPNTNPQGATGQAAILSIQAASTTLTPSGTTVTISNGNLANNANITITGVSSAIPTGFGFLVESTSTLHTYSFHRLVPKATEVTTVAGIASAISTAATNVADINNFSDIYIISSSAPTQRADGTSLQEGDLWFDSSNDNLQVYTGSAFSIITPSQAVLDDVAIVSGAITYSEDLGLITDAASTGSSNGSLDIVADALEDERTFTVTAATGKFIIDGVDKPALTLHKGWTYTFDVSDASNANHPLRFYAGSSQYSTNVTVTGTQGQAGAKVQIVIPESQPTNFQYYCTNHSGMGNNITVVEDPIKAVADIASNVVTVGGIASNVTTVANNISNINSAVSNQSNINAAVSNASNINAAVSNASNINSAVSNASNINTVAGAISNVNAVGNNISNVNSVHNNASNINSAVSNATNINTVSASISDVNRYANEYQISNTAPGSPSAGDLWFDGSTNTLKNYNGSAWLGITSNSGIQNVADDTSPELAAALDCNNFNLTEVGTVSGNNLQIDFGTL